MGKEVIKLADLTIGDKLKVKKRLILNKDYGGWFITDEIKELEGEVITVKKVDYRIFTAEETTRTGWTVEMIEGFKIMNELEKLKSEEG